MPTYWKVLLNHRSLQLLILLLLCIGAFFPHLGDRPADLMEARNFVTAREIVQNGTWLVPTLNGVPRIAKPPLPTWITAITYILGGRIDDEGLLRLPAAMMGVILVFALWGASLSLSKNEHLAWVNAVVAATTFLIADMSRCGSWDIYCHSFMLLSIWCLIHGWEKSAPAYWIFLLAGILLACSFLSKGPVAFFSLLLPFCIAYGLAFGLAGILRQVKPLILALIIAVLLSSIWPALIYLKMPQLSSTVATTEASSWLVRHQRPFFFYGHFPLYSGIWAFAAAAAIFFPFARRRIGQVGSYRFIILWTLISLFLLSIVPEKKERYLLPTMVPLSLLIGHLIYGILTAWAKGALGNKDIRLLFIQAIAVVSVALAAPVILFLFGVENRLIPIPNAVIWSIIFCTVGVSCIYFLIKKSAPGIFSLCVIVVFLINIAVLPSLYQMLKISYHPGMNTVKESRDIPSIRNLPFFSFKELNPKVIWNLGKVVAIWDIKNNPNPTGGKPLVLLSLEKFSELFPPQSVSDFSVTPVAKFHYDPKNMKKYIYLAVVEFDGQDLYAGKNELILQKAND